MSEELFNPRIYTSAMNLVYAYVIGKSGILEDAQDIFHEGLMIFMRKASQNKLKLTCAPEVYILGICKNLWRKRKPKHDTLSLSSMDDFVDNFGENLKAKHNKEQLIQLIEKHIKNLSLKCQEIFKYKKEGLTCEEIAQKMNLDNDQIARNKMYSCKKRLWDLIEQDPEYKQIIGNE